MNVLFLTMYSFYDIDRKNIYTDLMRRFINDGHYVFVVAPIESCKGENTSVIEGIGYRILKVRTGNQTNVSLIEKGLSTVLIGSQFMNAIRKYYDGIKFDLILYSTPPITLSNVVKRLKIKHNAKTYLMLKDIFPQNAVDLGMLSNSGILYSYFRWREKQLYHFSDYIGCMSNANINYIRKHNAEINSEKIVLCPNSIDPKPYSRLSKTKREELRIKYDIPVDKKVFLFGGNLGRPQGIDFVLECLSACKKIDSAFFVLIGSGNEYEKIKSFCDLQEVKNAQLISELPKDEYENLVGAFDVGMIFLDHRFTIPNYPSRILSYMNSGLPILAATDPNTDLGSDIVNGGFGWWCESNDVLGFKIKVEEAIKCDLDKMGEAGYKYLVKNFSTEIVYKLIFQTIQDN